MDAESNDVFRVLDFGTRLELLAETQSRYLELLRDRGFDSDQAFALVRDWSQHAWEWTVCDPRQRLPLGPPMLDVPDPLLSHDPSVARPGEPYLLTEEEEAELPDLRGNDPGNVSRLDPWRRRDGGAELDEAA